MNAHHAQTVLDAQRIRQLERACLDLLARVEAQDRRIRELEDVCRVRLARKRNVRMGWKT